MSDLTETIIATLALCVVAFLAVGFGLLVNSTSCHAKANASQVESQWGVFKGCIVKVDGNWIPYDRWWNEQN